MTDLMIRNLQLARAGLDKDNIRYFSSQQKLIAYAPCKTDLKHRSLRPTTLRVSITPNDSGILFESSLPLCLNITTENEQRLVLKRIAKENYGTIRGCLTLAENNQLNYRLFYFLGEDAACFNADEISASVGLCVTALSDGYESIVNALDEIDSSADDDSEDAPESMKAELDALFERLFVSHPETKPSLPLNQEYSTSEEIDNGNTDEPTDSDSIDPSLRSLLDDFLNEETCSE